jgi:hypothetical protein
MSARTVRLLAAVVAVLGLLVTVAGIALTVRSISAWQETRRVQSGPRVLAVIVHAGRISGLHQRATARYSDSTGAVHQVDVSYPLGRAQNVIVGESTSVRYDPRRPGRAELAGHPRHSWQDAALAAALTAVAAGVWLYRLFALLTAARRAEEEPRIRLGPPGTVERRPPPPSTRRHTYGTLATVSALLILGGRLVAQLAVIDRPQEVVFPPVPVLAAHQGRVELPRVLTAPPPPSGPLVTPGMARLIVAAAWRYRDKALAQHDVAELRVIDAEPALSIDVNRLKAGFAPERPEPVAGDLHDLTAFTPRQTQWPIRLLGQAVTTSAGVPSLEAIVLTRPGPAASWHVVLDAVVTASTGFSPAVMTPTLDPEGYNLLRSASAAPAGLVPALARYWQAFRETGSAPSGSDVFSPGYWTTGYGASIANQQDRTDRHNGLRAHVVYGDLSTPSDEVWSFGVLGTWTLVCSPMHETKTWTGPAHQDRDRQKWGVDLAPGVYQSITGEYVRTPCFVVPPAATPTGVGVFGADPWEVALRGTR